MPIAVNARAMEFGVAVQSVEGTAITNPQYAMPVFDGLPGPTQDINPIDVTDTANAMPIVWKTRAGWEGTVTTPVFADSIGALLKGILPTDTKTGVSDPVSHAFTPAGSDVFLTAFARRNDLFETFRDGMVSELTFSFNETDPVQAATTFMGKTVSLVGTSAYTATTTNLFSTTTEWMTPRAAVLKIDTAATPATTTVTNITSGSVSIRRQTDLIPAVETVTSNYIFRGTYEVGVTLDLVWANWDLYRASFFGGASGTASSPTIVNGSVDFLFQSNSNATHTLRLAVPQIALLVPNAPQPDAGGGPLRLAVDGMATRPPSGSVVTATVINAVTTAY